MKKLTIVQPEKSSDKVKILERKLKNKSLKGREDCVFFVENKISLGTLKRNLTIIADN